MIPKTEYVPSAYSCPFCGRGGIRARIYDEPDKGGFVEGRIGCECGANIYARMKSDGDALRQRLTERWNTRANSTRPGRWCKTHDGYFCPDCERYQKDKTRYCADCGKELE